MHFKTIGKFWGIFYVLDYKFTTTSVHVNKANIDTCNFANCFILPYSINTFKLNNKAWTLSPEPWTETLNKTNLTSRTIQAQSWINTWTEKSLKNSSWKKEMFSTRICHNRPHRLMSSMILKKNIKNVLEYFKIYLKMPPPTSRIKNETLPVARNKYPYCSFKNHPLSAVKMKVQ